MEFSEVVKKRRSVRAYEPREVPDELVQKVLECGHMAPTGGNIQPWEFIVIKSEEIKRQATNVTYRGNTFDLASHQEWIATAPVLIAVIGNRKRAAERYGHTSTNALIYLDCSACIENMLLAAVDLGLGACYISGYFEPLMSRVLKLPLEYEAVALVSLGYPAVDPVMRPKKPLDSIVHKEYYGGQ